MIRNLTFALLVALPLHWAWETAHGVAYIETNLPVLTRALHCLPMAVVDAVWTAGLIAIAVVAASATARWRLRWPLVAVAGFGSAVAVELWALHHGRWRYTSLMPLLPVANVGLWPVLQMTVLPAAVLWLVERRLSAVQR